MRDILNALWAAILGIGVGTVVGVPAAMVAETIVPRVMGARNQRS